MAIYKLQDLLPETYEQEDIDGHLKTFLDAFQDKLEEMHDDELALRLLQGIFTTPSKYLKYIARSLGWQLQSDTEAGKRAEASRIVDYYDLKGTPYGIRALAQQHFGSIFDRLIEFYVPTSDSASSITEDYSAADVVLTELLTEQGDFLTPTWAETQRAALGRAYGFDQTERKYSYFIRCEVTAENYTPGELREKVEAYINHYATMHPAGRFGYLYFVAQGMTNDDIQLGVDLANDLVGGLYLDTLWTLDDDKTLDDPPSPLHQSQSWLLTTQPDTLDIARVLDDGWYLDDTHTTVGVLIELP